MDAPHEPEIPLNLVLGGLRQRIPLMLLMGFAGYTFWQAVK